VVVLRSGISARGEGPEDGNPSIFSLSPSREGRGLGRFTVIGKAGSAEVPANCDSRARAERKD